MNKFLYIVLITGFCVLHPHALAQETEGGDTVTVEQKAVDKDKPWRLKDGDQKKKKKKKAPSFNKQFKSMARDLLGQPHWSDRFMALVENDLPKIAIHPFDEKDIPISLEEASFYVDGLTRALIKQAGDRYAVVGRKEIGAVVEDINQMGTRSDSINPLGDLFDRARSDLLGVGSMSLSGERIIMTFKLVETESGRIVSSSQKPFKRLKKNEDQILKGLSVDGAAQAAIEYLMRDVYNVRKIMVQGMPYQTSGVHTDFGRYFTGILSNNLRQVAARGARNIQNMDVTEFVVEEETFRGLKLAGHGVEQAALNDEQGNDYLLKGTYWVFEHHVEVRLELMGRSKSSYSWRGKILKSEIPAEFALVPPPAPVDETPYRSVGPIDLYLSSNKGENSDFKLGEKMNLVLKAKEDAFVYCYYMQADGNILRIFPNRFLKDAKISGGFTQHIPSKSMPFAFEISKPLGVEAVKCFAADQDLEGPLSVHLSKPDFSVLDVKTEAQLTKIYRDLTNVALSEATLVVTTHP